LNSVLILAGNVLVCATFGWAVLCVGAHERSSTETLFLSILVGMYIETLVAAIQMFLGLSLGIAGFTTVVAMAGVAIGIFYKHGVKTVRFAIDGPKWYEWLVLAAIAEKVLFAVWQLTRTHAYFQDALLHWSGRARALYGQANWSFDPSSPFFMGGYIGNRSYPLLTVLWRSLNAKFSGNWNDLIARADSLIFFVVVVGIVWIAVYRISNLRWMGAAAAYIVAAIPLHAWHAAAGYSDIAVEAFCVASVAALLRREWLWAGVMSAGAIWSKNDALVLYMPGIFAAAALMQVDTAKRQLDWRNLRQFLMGFATVLPWLAFNFIHGLGLTSAGGQLGWHGDAPSLLWHALIESPTSSILWICILAAIVYTGMPMLKDLTGRALMAGFFLSLSAILFIFTATSAYEFLLDETTIHRVMMQFSGMAILTAMYGLSLKTPEFATAAATAKKSKLRRSA